MRRVLLSAVFGLSIPFLTLGVACGPQRTALPEVKQEASGPRNTWGMPFVHRTEAQGTQAERDAGRAIVYIRFADGGSATGFFVSPDGLLMTNHHVFPRYRCSKDRCAGYQLIRHFAPGGDFEVFDRFRVIAQSEDLDFALLQVELPPKHTVPYLSLATENEMKETDWSDRRLWIGGYPHGGALAFSDALYKHRVGPRMNLVSVAISGNSGSPLVDAESGKVIGLYNGSEWIKYQINKKSGDVPHQGIASDVGRIQSILKKVFPDFGQSESWTAQAFAKSVPHERFEKILPKPDPSFPKITESIENFVSQSLSTQNEAQALADLSLRLGSEVDSAEYLSYSVDALLYAALLAGRRLQFDVPSIDRLAEIFAADHFDRELTTRQLRVHAAIETSSDCLTSVPAERPSGWFLYYASGICHSEVLPDGRPVLDTLESLVSNGDPKSEFRQLLLRTALNVVRHSLALDSMEPRRIALSQRVLKTIVDEADFWGTVSEAEGTLLLLENLPQLLAFGGMQRSFSTPQRPFLIWKGPTD